MCRLTWPDQIWRLTLCARRPLADAGRVGHQHLSRDIAALLGLAHLLLPVASPFPSTSAGSSSGILALTERSVPGVRTPWRDFARLTALAHTIHCLQACDGHACSAEHSHHLQITRPRRPDASASSRGVLLREMWSRDGTRGSRCVAPGRSGDTCWYFSRALCAAKAGASDA